MGERSVTSRRDITSSSIVTGDHNAVTTFYTKTTIPLPERVDIHAELAALRAELEALRSADIKKIGRALDNAEEVSASPGADKGEIAAALERAMAYAAKAEDFTTKTEKLVPRIRAIAGWLGDHGPRLLGHVGLSL